MSTDTNMAAISGDFLRIDDSVKVFADEDNPADKATDANTTGDVMAGDPFRGVQPDTSMDFGGVPDDQDAIRTASGHTSFIDHIFTERSHFGGKDELPSDIAAGIPVKPMRRVATDSRQAAADRHAILRYTLGAPPNGQRVAISRDTRRRIKVINLGPGILSVAADDSVSPNGPNTLTIPPPDTITPTPTGVQASSGDVAAAAAGSVALPAGASLTGFYLIGQSVGAGVNFDATVTGVAGGTMTFPLRFQTSEVTYPFTFPTALPPADPNTGIVLSVPAVVGGGVYSLLITGQVTAAGSSSGNRFYQELFVTSEVWVASPVAGTVCEVLDEFYSE